MNGNGNGNGKGEGISGVINNNGNGNSSTGNGHTGNGNGNGHHRNNGHTRLKKFDYLIVGAGYAGSILAERLARGSRQQVLLVDRRPHIGGNAYEHYDATGLL